MADTLSLTDMAASARQAYPFTVMPKPVGPVCNLGCKYCYYLEKEQLYADKQGKRQAFTMPEPVLEQFIREYIAVQPAQLEEITFTWHGGEPTLAGLPYFRQIAALQRKHAGGRRISNQLQTNGMFIDDAWARFLAQEGWLVGISIDGPQVLHDAARPTKGGKGSFAGAMQAIELLVKHGAEFNTLTVVGSHNERYPLEVYRFLKAIGSRYMQFLPVQERHAASGFSVHQKDKGKVTPESVSPQGFGNFLVTVFDEWVRKDVGRCFVQHFDLLLTQHCGYPATLCAFDKYCGTALAMEHNGDVYACDHYVYADHRLGNILDTPLRQMAYSERQAGFGLEKYDSLAQECLQCPYLRYCYGECPKHRFGQNAQGEPKAYLCASYQQFFGHALPYMEAMRQLLLQGRAPAEVMGMVPGR